MCITCIISITCINCITLNSEKRFMPLTQLFPGGDLLSDDIIDSKDASASKNVVRKASNDSPAGLIQLK